MSEPAIPTEFDLMYPTLMAIDRLGGSGRNAEIAELVIELAPITEEHLSWEYPPDTSRQGPRVLYSIPFARTWLKRVKALANSERGVWSLTSDGHRYLKMDREDGDKALRKAVAEWRRDNERSLKAKAPSTKGRDIAEFSADNDGDNEKWREELINVLRSMPADAFERLTKRLLREEGFLNVEVTLVGPDGGIDGFGVYKASLISFPVKFQCKRYSGSVGPRPVRELRGVLGSDERGLLLTTGTFTRDAKSEASQNGMTLIDLIDGEELCKLLKQHGLGVSVTERVVQDVTVQPGFFESI